MTLGTNVFAAQYVAIQDKAESMIGTGSGTLGYGQTVQSSDVFNGNLIYKAQWDLLRYDIVNIRLHQDGVVPSIVTVNVGDPIGFGAASPNSNYDTLLEIALANRFKIDGSQSVISSKGTATYSTAWSTSVSLTLTATFATSAQARHFFNSGGKIRLSASLTGGSGSQQYNAWVQFLASAGIQSFGADTNPLINYYTLTNSYQTYYQGSLSTAYSANYFRLEAQTDVANNSTGTATVLTIRATLADSYVDPDVATGNVEPPGDSVDGTLSIDVTELKAAGSLLPSGSFAITSPVYSLSAISGS